MFQHVFKFNPYHDELGRFTTGESAGVKVIPPGGDRKVPIKVYNTRQRLFGNYMRRQADWLDEQARNHGYSSVQIMLEQNPRLFKRLSRKWRDMDIERHAVVKAVKRFLANPFGFQYD